MSPNVSRYTRITGWALPLAFGGLVFALVGVWASTQEGGASPTGTGALALRAEPASSLVGPRIDHLAEEVK